MSRDTTLIVKIHKKTVLALESDREWERKFQKWQSNTGPIISKPNLQSIMK